MIFSLLLLAAGAGEPQWNCAQPQVQQEMNWCAARDFERADARLNAQWARTVAAMKQRDTDGAPEWDKRPGHFATLREAQRAWLRYRDAHCTNEGYAARGGSMESLLVSTCKTVLTDARTKQLSDLVEQ